MLLFNIGKYTYVTGKHRDYYNLHPLGRNPSDLDDSIKSYDHMLYQSLNKIFREGSLSRNNHIKEFLRSHQHNVMKSTIMKMLEPEAILSRYFSKTELIKFSLLWIAVLAGYSESAELLVRSGADVNEPFGTHDPQVIDKNCRILQLVLQMHSSPENERFIRLVVDHGAGLQAQDSRGRTALYIAVINGRVQMAEMLLEKGADVNVVCDGRMTALLAAVRNAKNNELVPLLLKYGADAFAKVGSKSALHLLAHGPAEHAVDLARALVEKGVPVDVKYDGFYFTQPIHEAAWRRNNELVKFYLDHGANVNSQSNIGQSPLITAAQVGCSALVETLLKSAPVKYYTT